jgi:Family of unknown function (DUF6504)
MSRRYCDVIRVTTQRVGVAGDPEPAVPRAFRWRRRWYLVTAVLARWIEADQWWQSSATDRSGQDVAGRLDRLVWRVEARPRHGSALGVFDLQQLVVDELPGPSPPAQWTLVRAFD